MSLLYAAMEDALVVAAGDGDDWAASAALVDLDLECVAASPDEPHRVFVGTFSSGLHRSTDGGETFSKVAGAVWEVSSDSAIGSDPVTAVAVSPHDPDVVWVGTEPSRLYCSTDAGESFTEVVDLSTLSTADEWSFPPRPDTHHVRWIEVDPSDPDRLLVAVEAGALLLTEDGGDSWVERPEGARRDSHKLATHPGAPGRVYAAAGDGVAESYDGGHSWVRPERGLDHRYTWSTAVDPGDPDTVFVSAATGAHRAHSADGAESYVYRRTAPGPDADPGETPWTPLDDRGLPTGRGVLRAELAGGSEPGELFAVTNDGVYRTTSRGDHWRSLPLAWPDRFEAATCRGLVVV
jgi:photosystem II stability/assembly factor-like uncharacterized protein